MKQKVIGIYGIEDIATGNLYVGQSTDIAKRWSNHASFMKSGIHRYKELQEAYSEDCKRVKYTILEECTKDQLQEREDFWLKHVDRIDGWILINKQKSGGKNKVVKDTSNMCKAQSGRNNGNCKYDEKIIAEILWLKLNGYKAKDIEEMYEEVGIKSNYIYLVGVKKWIHLEPVKPNFIA